MEAVLVVVRAPAVGAGAEARAAVAGWADVAVTWCDDCPRGRGWGRELWGGVWQRCAACQFRGGSANGIDRPVADAGEAARARAAERAAGPP